MLNSSTGFVLSSRDSGVHTPWWSGNSQSGAQRPATSRCSVRRLPAYSTHLHQGPHFYWDPRQCQNRWKWQLPYLQLTQKQVRIVAVTHHNEPHLKDGKSCFNLLLTMQYTNYQRLLIKWTKFEAWANHDKCRVAFASMKVGWGQVLFTLILTAAAAMRENGFTG